MTSVKDDNRLGKKEGKRFYAKQHGGPHSALYIYDKHRDHVKPKKYFAKHECVDAGFTLMDQLNEGMAIVQRNHTIRGQHKVATHELNQANDTIATLRTDNDNLRRSYNDAKFSAKRETELRRESDREAEGLRHHINQLQQELDQKYACCGPDPDVPVVPASELDRVHRLYALSQARYDALLDKVTDMHNFTASVTVVDPFAEERDNLRARILELVEYNEQLRNSLQMTAWSDRNREEFIADLQQRIEEHFQENE